MINSISTLYKKQPIMNSFVIRLSFMFKSYNSIIMLVALFIRIGRMNLFLNFMFKSYNSIIMLVALFIRIGRMNLFLNFMVYCLFNNYIHFATNLIFSDS